jgi:hypothetical protein
MPLLSSDLERYSIYLPRTAKSARCSRLDTAKTGLKVARRLRGLETTFAHRSCSIAIRLESSMRSTPRFARYPGCKDDLRSVIGTTSDD